MVVAWLCAWHLLYACSCRWWMDGWMIRSPLLFQFTSSQVPPIHSFDSRFSYKNSTNLDPFFCLFALIFVCSLVYPPSRSWLEVSCSSNNNVRQTNIKICITKTKVWMVCDIFLSSLLRSSPLYSSLIYFAIPSFAPLPAQMSPLRHKTVPPNNAVLYGICNMLTCCCKPSSFDVRCFFASFVVESETISSVLCFICWLMVA